MTVHSRDLLTTGEAAVLLRATRQHVADLCDRGLLPHVRVGTHRRIRRCDVEALLTPAMNREQVKALWLHRAVAGRLVVEPHVVLARADRNLERLRAISPPGGREAEWLERWAALLDEGVEAVLSALTSPSAYAIELRRHSPFGGVLAEGERRAVLASFAASWRDRARRMPSDQLARVLGER